MDKGCIDMSKGNQD